VSGGKAVDPRRIEEILSIRSDDSSRSIPRPSETSTGVNIRSGKIAEVVKRFENTAIVVDGITASVSSTFPWMHGGSMW